MCSFVSSIVAKVVTSSSSENYIKQIRQKLHVATISLGFQAFLKFFGLPLNFKPCVLGFKL
jgi:thiol:disulfide interchange protein